MPDPKISTGAEITHAIESAWSDLEAFLGDLAEKQASLQDDHGWTVRDHLTHLAVWEDSVAILFRGQPRHEALGIGESFYAEASFDQINEIIRDRHKHMPLHQVLEQLNQVHHPLMARVRALTDLELNRTVRDFFPQAPRTDDRRVIDFIYENTAAHYTEHLPWMRALLERPA